MANAAPHAHEDWFTPPAAQPTDWSLVVSERTLIAVAGIAAVLVLFAIAQRLLGDPEWPRLGLFSRMAAGAPTLLAVQTAITLIYVSVQPALLAPHLTLPTAAWGLAFAAVQVLVAFTFITGLFDRVGAVGLVILWLSALALFRPTEALENALYVGIAVAVFVIGRTAIAAGRPRPPFTSNEWARRAILALRVLGGVSFLTLGFADKIWNPDLGAAFLNEYPSFNVFRLAGFDWVSDATFIMLAGIVEASIGTLLIAGLLTRLVIVAMFVPFNATVPFLPPVEMLGHLPIFGLMYMLLVYGAGTSHEEVSRTEP